MQKIFEKLNFPLVVGGCNILVESLPSKDDLKSYIICIANILLFVYYIKGKPVSKIKRIWRSFFGEIKRKKKIKDMIWIEHYISKASLTGFPLYFFTSFSPESGDPSWSPASLTQLSNKTGYSIDELAVPEEKIESIGETVIS